MSNYNENIYQDYADNIYKRIILIEKITDKNIQEIKEKAQIELTSRMLRVANIISEASRRKGDYILASFVCCTQLNIIQKDEKL